MHTGISKSTLFLILISSFAFSSGLQAIARYKAWPLENLHDKNAENGQSQVSFAFKTFSRADCYKYLGRSKILSRGYQPIQIQITNNTKKSFVFSLDTFNIPCFSYIDVVEGVNFNTTKRLVGWGIGSLFIWPLIIPFAIEAVECPKANERLEADFARKALHNQIIEPNSVVNGLIFVPVRFDQNFFFVLRDTKNDERTTLSLVNPNAVVGW